MPNFNYDDIKENTKKEENYSPNRAKTSPNTYGALKKAAERFTKIIPEDVKNELVENVIEAGMTYLNVPGKTETKGNGEKPILLKPEMIKSFIKNAAKAMEEAKKNVDIKENVTPEEEVTPITDNVEIPKEENVENTENNDLFNFNIENDIDPTVTENENEEKTEVEVETEPETEVKNDEFNFDTMFNFEEPKLENNDDVVEEEKETEESNSFNTEEQNTSNYVTEMQQSLESVKTPFANDLPNKEEDVQETPEMNSENVYSYSVKGGSSQLYDECRRLSYIVNSYEKQQYQFEEELKIENDAKAQLEAQIAEHDENIRNIEQNRTNAYEVYLQAKKELEPIAALFGNAINMNDNFNNNEMESGFKK